jgi:hypothetical protein
LAGRSKGEPGSPENSGLREADCRVLGSAEPLSTKAKAHVGDARLDHCSAELLGVVEGGMSRRDDNESLEPLVVGLGRSNRHSGDVAYNLPGREVAAWRRVGRMGPIKHGGPGEQKPGRSEGPWGRAAKSARTEVLKRAASPGTVRGFRRSKRRARRTRANRLT